MNLGCWPTSGLLLILAIEPHVGPCIDLTYICFDSTSSVLQHPRAFGMVLGILYSAILPPTSTQSVHSTPSFGSGSSLGVIAPISFEGFQDYFPVITKGPSDLCLLLPLMNMDHN